MSITCGYYYLSSRFGVYRQKAINWADFAFEEAGPKFWYHGSEAKFVQSLKQDQLKGLSIHLSIEQASPAEIVSLAAPYWDAVELIDIQDEPPGNKFEVGVLATMIKAAVSNEGLPPVPVGAVFSAERIEHSNGFLCTELDWVGWELYVHHKFQATKAKTVAECNRLAAEMLNVMPDKPLVVVGKAYDKRGDDGRPTWFKISTLVDLQDATFQAIRFDPRVQFLRWFAYGWPGGVKDHLQLRTAHKAISKAARADRG